MHNLEVMVAKAKAKIVDSKVYPKYLRDELKSYAFSSNHLSTDISELCNIVKRLLKSGNAEKFYSSFYSRIVMNATKVFEGLSRNAATLLASKTADCLLAKKKAKDEAEIPHLATKFSDRNIWFTVHWWLCSSQAIHQAFQEGQFNKKPTIDVNSQDWKSR